MRTQCLQTARMTRYSGKEWYYGADLATPIIAARAGDIT
jgi:hypothetical protein